MPNWCYNIVEFSHCESTELRKLVEGYNSGKLFETFLPPPNGEWDYNWCRENWGTKWDSGGGEGFDKVSTDNINDSVSLIFDTAWGPPIRFYSAMESFGWAIEAMYYEPGMQFCGIYQNGLNEHYEIRGDSAWVEQNIPTDLNFAFSISKEMSEYENDQ